MDATAEKLEGTPLIRASSTDHPLYDGVVEACRTVHDPEIPVNIFDLGLIYTIEIDVEGHVDIWMTLTAPDPASRDSTLQPPPGRVLDWLYVKGANGWPFLYWRNADARPPWERK